MGVATLLLILFAVAFGLGALLPLRPPWLIAAGVAGVFGWWIWTVADGCDRTSEIRCGWQPVVAWIFALLLVAAWLAGLGCGLLVRRTLQRRAR